MSCDLPSAALSSRPVDGVGECVRAVADLFFDLLLRLRGQEDVDLIHDIRVTSRRLNEALGVLGAVSGDEQLASSREWLREVRGYVAPIRDADVMAHRVTRLIEDEPGRAVLSAGTEFLNELQRQRVWRLEDARLRLKPEQVLVRREALARRLSDLLGDSRGRVQGVEHALSRHLMRRLRRRKKAFMQLGAKAARSPRGERLHAARIAAKKLRYTLELAERARLLDGARQLERIRRVQDYLGDLNDWAVLAERLSDSAGRLSPLAQHGLGLLVKKVSLRRKRLIRGFSHHWSRTRRGVKTLI